MVLTLVLIYGVWTETGIYTALSFFLIFVAIEALTYQIGKMK